MEWRPGAILAGKYRYERELGEGGMGRVVVATHLVLRQPVALKVLTRTRSPDAARRFLREARLAFRISSPHVTKVLDVGQLEDGTPYIAMELLDGATFATLAEQRGALPVAEACNLVLQACAGVGEAHALGIVHRDVKLANLFVVSTPRGPFVKVLDFGCAKAERVGESSVAHATEDGAWLGTPRYMAPEQLISARDVDARADVWALGQVLYTLLAGRPPFDGTTLRVLYEQIQRSPAAPIGRPLPHGLAAVVDRCLRKAPEERFADARQLAIALAPFARPRRGHTIHFLLATIVLASLGTCAVLLALTWRREPRTASATSATAAIAAPPPSTMPAPSAVASHRAPAPPPPAVPPDHPRARRAAPATRDPLPSSTRIPSVPEQLASQTVAERICGMEFFVDCYAITEDDCIPAMRKNYLECLDAADRPTCMVRKFEALYPQKGLKACAELAHGGDQKNR